MTRFSKILITGVSLVVVAAGAFVANYHSSLNWRLRLMAQKFGGVLPEMTWSEFAEFTFGRDRYGLGRFVAEGRSLEGTLTNPYVTEVDQAHGMEIFKDRCSMCHGTDASGGHGPSLLRPSYDHGDSEFGIYKILRDGIPGTAMAPTNLSAKERWQVVGYLRMLRTAAVRSAGGLGPIPSINVTSAQLVAAASHENSWLTYSGSYRGWRYTPLAEIDTSTVSRLRPIWMRQFPGESMINEATPLVVDGMMFVSESPSDAVALDVRTGEVLWRYERNLPAELPVCCGKVNRGLAVLGGSVYLGTLDGHLLSLDARNGQVQWDRKVASSDRGYTITGAPLAYGNSIIVGVGGGEYATRGYLAAYEATTGHQQWRFYTIPEPGQPGSETWENDAWRTGGGATWVTGSYDPEAKLLYWGVGNPAPDYQAEVRPGDNLYTDSVIALHADTGKLAWHFQFTPRDDHDWDSAQTPILTELTVNGARRKVICWANRNGFYYVLDRLTGEFLAGTPFVRQNWATGLDAKGRPILSQTGRVSNGGTLTFPGVRGATNWEPSAFHPVLGLVYVPANEQGSIVTRSPAHNVLRGAMGFYVGSGAANPEPPVPVVRALDAVTGKKRWEYFAPVEHGSGTLTGLLTTGGGLVFGASGGRAFALDANDGHELWQLPLGGPTHAPPISFELEGHQVLAFWAGRTMFLFGTEPPQKQSAPTWPETRETRNSPQPPQMRAGGG
jgi:alcohol dehydrogenase (cytochrome c)